MGGDKEARGWLNIQTRLIITRPWESVRFDWTPATVQTENSDNRTLRDCWFYVSSKMRHLT